MCIRFAKIWRKLYDRMISKWGQFQVNTINMIDIIVTHAAGFIVALGAAVIGNYWNKSIRDHVRIVRIKSSTDKLAERIKILYEELFPEEEGTNYDREELARFMDASFRDPRHIEVENIVFAALYKEAVVGFIFCHFYPKPKKAIISFFGVTQDKAHNMQVATI